MNKVRLAAVASFVAAICCFTPLAHAQATRTWVSGVGDDAMPCSRTAPCKTFAGTISKTAVGGEIDTLDPGGFGALTITKSITIDGTSGLAGVIVSSGINAFVVSAANTDVVILRNLDFNGIGTGLNGIRIISAGDVRIENCKIYGFANRGISDERTSGRLVVTDTMVNNNGQTGIVVLPGGVSTLTVNLDRVRMDGNGNSGFAISLGAKALATHSAASGNVNYGFYADGGSTMTLEDCTASANNYGVFDMSGATILVSNSTLTINNIGLFASGGNIYSFGNNRILGNASLNGTPNAILPQQ